MTAANRQCADIRVSGRVQGVFFRAHIQKTARTLGLSGFVENLSDGNVRIVADGPRDAIKKLLSWCASDAVSLASVKDITVEWQTPKTKFPDFTIR